MSMKDLEEVFELVQQNDDQADFHGPKTESLVSNAEQALGLSFPPTYRAFLLQYGCGGFRGREFYGVIKGDYVNSDIPHVVVPDAVWATLSWRREFQFPESHILIGVTGDGGDYAIDCSRPSGTGECPVVEMWPMSDQIVIAQDFGEFLLQSIRDALSD